MVLHTSPQMYRSSSTSLSPDQRKRYRSGHEQNQHSPTYAVLWPCKRSTDPCPALSQTIRADPFVLNLDWTWKTPARHSSIDVAHPLLSLRLGTTLRDAYKREGKWSLACSHHLWRPDFRQLAMQQTTSRRIDAITWWQRSKKLVSKLLFDVVQRIPYVDQQAKEDEDLFICVFDEEKMSPLTHIRLLHFLGLIYVLRGLRRRHCQSAGSLYAWRAVGQAVVLNIQKHFLRVSYIVHREHQVAWWAGKCSKLRIGHGQGTDSKLSKMWTV